MTEIDWLHRDRLDLRSPGKEGLSLWYVRSVIPEMGVDGKAIYTARRYGKPVDEAKLVETAIAMGDPLMLPLDHRFDMENAREYSDDDAVVIKLEDGLLILRRSFAGRFGVKAQTTSRESCQAAINVIEPLLVKDGDRPGGDVRILLNRWGELTAAATGEVSCPLERDNYPDQVLDGFDSTLANIESKKPVGRLIMLEGSPGTGKSYFLRALVHAAPQCTFLYMASSLIGSITGPDIMQAVSTLRDRQSRERTVRNGRLPVESPIVIVCEDADMGIVKRAGDNYSGIADLLNLADGIPGEALDMRIIASTNAKKLDIDEAITRPGRLARRVDFTPLSPSHAQRVYDRLTENVGTMRFEWPATVADVYSAALSGIAPTEPKQSIGFPGFGR